MLNIKDLKFKKLNLADVRTLIDWARKEGWNPGPNDAEVFYATDPDGFYGYYWNDELIAGGALISYNNEFGFMGLFIVQSEYRSKGIGRDLWYHRRDLLKSRLNPDSTIGMDGVVDMQHFYKKGGFDICFKDERYEKIGAEFLVDEHITSIQEEDFEEIMEYDKKCFGFERTQFLKPWIQLPENKNFKYVEDNQVRGFCIVRKVDKGFKIGPLFADNAAIAEELYKASLNAVIGSPLYLDIPIINEAAVQMVKKYKAQYVFECARMYNGKTPPIPMDKVFGITSFELG